jgi:uncharacterized protein
MRKRYLGFAAMTPELRRQLSSRGGRRAHAKGTAYEWTREEAVRAGQKGGRAAAAARAARQDEAGAADRAILGGEPL